MLYHANLLVEKIASRKAKSRLRWFIGLFLLALTLPMIFLVQSGYKQLKKEEYYKYLWHAQHILKQITDDVSTLLHAEANRPYDDYRFFKISDDPVLKQQQLTLSPLANVSEFSKIPGMIGYFHIDETGAYSCPTLPYTDSKSLKKYIAQFSEKEINSRLERREKLRQLLMENNIIDPNKYAPYGYWQKEDARGDIFTKIDSSDSQEPRKANNEEIPPDIALLDTIVRIEPLQLSVAKTGELIFYRHAWKGENQITQGFVVNNEEFLFTPLKKYLEASNFTHKVFIQVVSENINIGGLLFDPLTSTVNAAEPDQKQLKILLFDKPLYDTLAKLTFKISSSGLPMGAGIRTGIFLLVIMIGIVLAGLLAIYRLGIRQIDLNEERLNFVSSVSHELKTPLTSIIMYADMLRGGMVSSEDKRMSYYNFIYYESERLGRLISNILRLSRIGRANPNITLEYTPVSVAVDIVRSKISTLIENNGYKLEFNIDNLRCDSHELLIDTDAFTQIIINLVDNAIKFSLDSCKDCPERKRVTLSLCCDKQHGDFLCFSVRDFGPGIPKEHSKHIFEVFYRAENELTRKTQGTGIGLALVCELAKTMGGRVEFSNCDPGVEFRVYLQYRVLA